MAILKDKLAGNARESVRNIAYSPGNPGGFEAEPDFTELATSGDGNSDARTAERYVDGKAPGLNVRYAKQRV